MLTNSQRLPESFQQLPFAHQRVAAACLAGIAASAASVSEQSQHCVIKKEKGVGAFLPRPLVTAHTLLEQSVCRRRGSARDLTIEHHHIGRLFELNVHAVCFTIHLSHRTHLPDLLIILEYYASARINKSL